MQRAAALIVLLGFAGLALFACRSAGIVRSPAGPDCLPVWLAPRAGSASVWVLARSGCGHCEAHFAALGRAARSLPPDARARVLERIHVVGGGDDAPAGVQREPDSLLAVLGVWLVPTTWLVDAEGRVQEAWRGERGEPAWRRALDLVGVPSETR